MAIEFRLRDWLRPPVNVLREAGVLPGMTVLDFGCGPGSFSLASARLVGTQGHVYALDIHPLAIHMVMCAAERQSLWNIHPIHGSYPDDLPNESTDAVLLYDVLHDLSEINPILREIHRILKPAGILSASDHHLGESSLRNIVTGSGFFRLADCNRRTCQFRRLGVGEGAV
jgi:ubiquinone/menaquinone biosynthesis C-methylase UbiE